jgi:2-aminoadipate transaminase
MEWMRFFPPEVRRALAYEPPGTWIPPHVPGAVRLNAGYPFPESVPVTELAAAMQALLAAEGDRPLHYSGSPAMNRLPALLAARSAARGMPVGEGEMLVTAGAAQVLDLTARALLGPDDLVAVEAPTYMEVLEIFRNYTPHMLSYPVDAGGLVVEALADDLAERRAAGRRLPKLLYTVASFQNPTGATMSLARRQRLLALAEAYDFLILEDDAYGELAFGAVPVPLRAVDPVRANRVIYAGSLSKVVGPGLRVGWVTAAAPLVTALSLYKKDLEHPLTQAITAQYLADVDFGARVDWLRGQYRARRDAMLGLLGQYMPAGVTWRVPDGGFFIWLETPAVDTAALLPEALRAGVGYVPGKYFYFDAGAGREALRLSFSYLALDQMEQGVAALGRVLRERL